MRFGGIISLKVLIKQGPKLSVRTKVKVVIRSEGLIVKKITKLLHNIHIVTFQVIHNFIKKFYLHYISIHPNFNQNQNVLERFWHKWPLRSYFIL